MSDENDFHMNRERELRNFVAWNDDFIGMII